MSRARGWLTHLALAVALVCAVHAVALWLVPRAIMQRVLSSVPEAGDRARGAYFPPMTDASQRRIVMPSPDLLYATCVFDLSSRPLRVRADPKTRGYWSIALYAANSDNFFVINDRQAQGRPVDLLLVGSDRGAVTAPDGALVVRAPGARGMLLMRVLTGDYATEKAEVEAARRTLSCEPA